MSPSNELDLSESIQAGVTRRSLLRTTAGVVAAGGLTGALGACGSSGSTTGSPGPSTGAEPESSPVRGGVLRFGSQGQSSGDHLEAQAPSTQADFARAWQLYSPLARVDAAFEIEMDLAESITPNKDATEWTIKIKPGITFHNGKELTAKDVLFTFQRMISQEFSGAVMVPELEIPRATILDKHTLRIPCSQPFANFVEVMVSSPFFFIIPEGYDPNNPVGTGPFKYKSFTPGQESEFVRFADYYESGLPYLDAITTLDFADEQSQINALLGGSVDLTDLLSGQAISSLESGGASVVVSTGGGCNLFTMRVDKPPFNDSRVRLALKELVDRSQMNDVVFAGKGKIGNDILGYGDPAYNTALPQREPDIEKAKSLLKQAGHQDGLNVQLTTTALSQGFLGQSQVLAQQASSAGMKIELRELTLTNWFNGYTEYDFSIDYSNAGYILGFAPLVTLKSAAFNETGWGDGKFAKLYKEATATTDSARQTELIHAMQELEYAEDGYVLPIFPPLVDAHSGKVGGLPALAKAQYPCANYAWKSMWLGS